MSRWDELFILINGLPGFYNLIQFSPEEPPFVVVGRTTCSLGAGSSRPAALACKDAPAATAWGSDARNSVKLACRIDYWPQRPATARTFPGAASQIARTEMALHPAAIQNAIE